MGFGGSFLHDKGQCFAGLLFAFGLSRLMGTNLVSSLIDDSFSRLTYSVLSKITTPSPYPVARSARSYLLSVSLLFMPQFFVYCS